MGICPIFHDNGVIQRSSLFFCHRRCFTKDEVRKESYKYELRATNGGREGRKIASQCYDVSDLNKVLAKLFYFKSKHFYVCGIPQEYFQKENQQQAADNVALIAQSMLCNNKMYKGNTLVTSNAEVYNLLNNLWWGKGRKYRIILAPDAPIPSNELLIIARPPMTFYSPILACPMINSKHFEEFALARNMNQIIIDPKECNFPIIQKYSKIHKIYEEYINTYRPTTWHVEFWSKWIKNFVTTLHFITPKKWLRFRPDSR